MTMSEPLLSNITFEVFSKQIESLCEQRNIEYIDAIVHWCETNNVEVEYAANFIKKNQVLKLKVQKEAEDLNYIKKTARLPS